MDIYFANFFLECELFQICREKQISNLIFKKGFRKPCRLSDNVARYRSARQVTDDNKCDAGKRRFACRISKGRTQTTLM